MLIDLSDDPLIRRLQQADLAVHAASMERANALLALREKCSHDKVAECEVRLSGIWNDREPERRICETCGTEEEYDGCGKWHVLSTPYVRPVSRDELYRLRK